jgi:hypothetical protein
MPPNTQRESDRIVRGQLIWQLREGHAHVPLTEAVAGLAPELVGTRPAGTPHSLWEQLEHMRIAQSDILLFSRSAGHVSPKWPEGYWPASPVPPDGSAWQESMRAFEADLESFAEMLGDPARDLHSPFPWGDGQTLMREALVLADHNAYHVGQIVLLRRLLGSWPA